MDKVREQLVDRMAVQMRRELLSNAHKGTEWREADPADLDCDVLYHVLKLSLAVKAKDKDAVREYAADVANCAAILADHFGVLENPGNPEDAAEYDGHGNEALHAFADRLYDEIQEWKVSDAA